MSMTHNAPRLLIAGVSSGVGKTTFTFGLCRALMRRGLRVGVFKCGPDYLDPTHHRRASRGPVHNLDSWLMPPDALRDTLARNAAQVDVSLIEGVMGLFDGASSTELTGSSAEIAQLTETPIVLVCDASGMARSVAALVHGFCSFEPGISPRAVVCNRIGSPGHLALLRSAAIGGPPIVGGLPKNELHRIPSRHLGLVAAQELDGEATFETWADLVEQHCDLDALLALARSAPPLTAANSTERSAPTRELAPVPCRIAVARDDAFHFYYDANLRLLEAAGAELVEFSPLTAATLPEVDGVYIGGGYPELHAAQLAAHDVMRAALRAHAAAGKPIYAECGGLMYLADAIVDRRGVRHSMLGLIAGTATMQASLQALGYTEVETRDNSPLGPAGTRYRGHQFRYSIFETDEAPQRLALHAPRTARTSIEGYGHANILASYVHAHWSSAPEIPAAFVAACLASRR
ncbi:MAG: cobyrinate a,c-diamide synthase [Polyangiales bacterium]